MKRKKPSTKRPETVILLHGVGHSRLNMMGMARALDKAGFHTINVSYPSTRLNLTDLALLVGRKIGEAGVHGGHKLHFVTHSLGGLVAQKYLETLEEGPRQQIGRVVMLGTPNQGNEVADYMEHFPPYRWLFGPVGQELTTATRSASLSQPFYETGIIAGTVRWPYPIANAFIDRDGAAHDGRVTVDSTKTPWMTDHVTLPITHGLMAWFAAAQTQTIHFLNNGVFSHE